MKALSLNQNSEFVLFVGDMLHPIHDLAVEPFLNCDVRHGRGGCSAVPMLLSRRESNHIAGVNLLDRAAFPLRPTAAGGHDEGLPKRMRMPRSPCARLKGDQGAGNESWVGSLKQRINADCAGKPVCGALAGWLRADTFDFHERILNRTHTGLRPGQCCSVGTCGHV